MERREQQEQDVPDATPAKNERFHGMLQRLSLIRSTQLFLRVSSSSRTQYHSGFDYSVNKYGTLDANVLVVQQLQFGDGQEIFRRVLGSHREKSLSGTDQSETSVFRKKYTTPTQPLCRIGNTRWTCVLAVEAIESPSSLDNKNPLVTIGPDKYFGSFTIFREKHGAMAHRACY